MSTSRVYEPIHTLKNLYNCSTASFFPFVYVYGFFKVEYLYYLPKLHRLEPHYQTVRLKARALTGSTFGVYGRFKSEVHTNKESVDNLNFFNDTVFITVMFGSILQPNMTFYLSKR